MCKYEWCKLFAEALYKEIQLNRRTVKLIAHWADTNERTVKYWLEERCVPNSFSLMQLMVHSEYVRQLVWEVSGMHDSHMTKLFFMAMTKFMKPWMEHFPDK